MCLWRQIISSAVERPHDKVDRSRTVRARLFLVERWFLETGTSVPVSPVWTRATGREAFAIDRERFGNVSCGHDLSVVSISFMHSSPSLSVLLFSAARCCSQLSLLISSCIATLIFCSSRLRLWLPCSLSVCTLTCLLATLLLYFYCSVSVDPF